MSTDEHGYAGNLAPTRSAREISTIPTKMWSVASKFCLKVNFSRDFLEICGLRPRIKRHNCTFVVGMGLSHRIRTRIKATAIPPLPTN